MRPLSTFILVALAVAALDCTAAWEPFHPDVTQKEFQDGSGSIDHLEPYVQLRKPGYHLAEFSVYPSFSKRHEWRIYLDGQRYVLRSWRLTGDQISTAKPDKSTVTEIEIPKDVAAIVYDIWTNALLETRYSRALSGGLDGTSYRFSTYVRGLGWFQGETWEPEDDLPPKWLVACGTLIYEYSRASKNSPEKLAAQLAEYRERLYAYWRLKGKH